MVRILSEFKNYELLRSESPAESISKILHFPIYLDFVDFLITKEKLTLFCSNGRVM